MTLLQPRTRWRPTAPRCGRLASAVIICFALACRETPPDEVAVRAPTRSGDVWELDRPENPRDAGGALLAFVSGTHVILVDGNDTYAGMLLTRGGKAPDGGQPLRLGGGVAATLAPVGDSLQLRFDSGERLALRRRTPAQESVR